MALTPSEIQDKNTNRFSAARVRLLHSPCVAFRELVARRYCETHRAIVQDCGNGSRQSVSDKPLIEPKMLIRHQWKDTGLRYTEQTVGEDHTSRNTWK